MLVDSGSLARPQPAVARYANRTARLCHLLSGSLQYRRPRHFPAVALVIFPELRRRLFDPCLTGFVPSPPGKRTEEAPEARRSAEALDAGQAHWSVRK